MNRKLIVFNILYVPKIMYRIEATEHEKFR